MSFEHELHNTRVTEVELDHKGSLNALAFYELFVREVGRMYLKLAERLSKYAIRYVFGFNAVVPDMYDRHSEYLTLTAYISSYGDSYVTLQVDPNNLRGVAVSRKVGTEEVESIVERMGTVAVSVALALVNSLNDNPACIKSLDCQEYLSRVDYVLDLFGRHGHYPTVDEEIFEHVAKVVNDQAIPLQHECKTSSVYTLLNYPVIYPENISKQTVDLGDVRATVDLTEQWLKVRFWRNEDMEDAVACEAHRGIVDTIYVYIVPNNIDAETYALAKDIARNWKNYVTRALDAYIERISNLNLHKTTKKDLTGLAKAWKKLIEDSEVKNTVII